MKRYVIDSLQNWLTTHNRKPLLLRGARQVGKSYAVREFAKSHFDDYVAINFELEPEAKDCFHTLKPANILKAIRAIKARPLTVGKTLLFLDEIQACPQAMQALRYFKEEMPELHVIAAGSLLELMLRKEAISLPVGRVEYLYMYPCSFLEFLSAKGQDQALDVLLTANQAQDIPKVVHDHLLNLFKEYMIVGGMPEAVQTYVDSDDFYSVQRVQNSILNTYRDDFGKYANESHHKYLEKVYQQAPGIVGSQVSYKKIDANFRSRDLKQAIDLLEQANVIKRIYATTASGLPLNSNLNEKKFKLLFLDVGLTQRRSALAASLLFSDDIMQLNAGSLAEQVVGQQLISMQDCFAPAELYFWARDKKSSQAEVDYVINVGGKIIPIEVKAGATGRLKSIQLLLHERSLPLGIKVSTAPLDLTGAVINIPIYMVSQLTRLVG